MKIYNLRLLVCLTFFIIITACKDSDKDEQPLLEPINFVSHNDIPEVMSTFYEKFNLGPGAIQKGSIETDNKYDIDVEAILEVVDSLENKNYTFRVDDKDNDVFTFTNLVIKKRESGVIDEPYFLEYIVDKEAKQEFVRANFSMAAFRGIFTKRYVNGTYANSNYKAQANLDQKSLSDPEVGSDLGPCDQVYDYMSDGGNLSGDGNGGIITGDYSGFTGGGVRTLVCFDVLEPITTTSECEVIKSDFGDFPTGPGCHMVINADGKGWHWEGSTTTTTWLRKKRCWYVYETTVESTSSCPDEESEDIGILGPVSSEYLIAKPEFNSVEEYANYLGFAASHFSQFPDMQEAALSLADALAIPYTFDEIRELAERSWRVVTTFNKYSGFGYSIDQISQSDQLQIASDLAYINFFPEIKTRISESDWPLTTQEWEALWEIFKPLMGELLLEAVLH